MVRINYDSSLARATTIVLSLFSILILWEFTSNHNNPLLFPSLNNIAFELYTIVFAAETYSNLIASIILVLKGFILSVLIAFPTALFCFRFKVVSWAIIPYHEFIRYIPVPALVPLCAAIFGIGDLTKILLVFIGTYFQLLFLYIVDFATVPKEYEDSARTLGLQGYKLTVMVTVRASLSDVLNTSRIAFAWAWSYLLVAEVVNSDKGIGYLVLQSYRVLNLPRLISYLIVIGAFGLLTDYLFKKLRLKLCPYTIN